MLHAARLLLALLPCAFAAAQTANEMLVRDYEKRRHEELIAAGQRHVDLGWSIKDKGLVAQATWQFVRAVEISEGKHQGAAMVLNIVRTYEEAFWKKRRKKPTRQSLAKYEKDAIAIERADMKAEIKLALLATKAKLPVQLTAHWLAAMRLGAEIEFGKNGARIEGEPVPADLAQWLSEQTVEIVGGGRRFEPAGAKAPRVANVRAFGNPQVVVRSDLPGTAAERFHALALAAWSAWIDRLDGAPIRPLNLFVFSKRVDYEQYLDACGHGASRGGSGLCDYATNQTLVCAEGLADEDVHALILHELSHLFFFATSPVAMPDWYAEGFAESFGGQGTFAWDGKLLKLGQAMRKDRIEAVQKQPMPLREMFAADAAQLLLNDHGKGMRFYAQCWAFQRFLLTTENPWQARFLAWEDKCRGAMNGAQSTVRFGDPKPAIAAFEAEFGAELKALEAAFFEYLRKL